jgi:hypothetical protein
MTEVLFVGGPRDGEQQSVHGGVRLPETLRAEEIEPIDISMFAVCPEVFTRTLTTWYRLGWFTLNGTDRLAVYVAEGITPYEAASAVLDRHARRELGWSIVVGPPDSREDFASPLEPVRIEPTPAPLLWHKCKGPERDPHDEVRWQGGVECWVCGQHGDPAAPPSVKDQAVAPYGWE